MTHQELFARIQIELDKMAQAVRENKEYTEALETVEKPSLYNATIGGIAMNLQGFYTGAERILEAVAKHIDGRRPKGDHWHRDLLIQMSTGDGEKRPPVISAETFDDLDEFLRFRHMVRNAYSYRLDADRVLANAARLPECFRNLSADCVAFQRSLDEGANSNT